MLRTPIIEQNEITIQPKYMLNNDCERCKTGLWSIYNLIKKIKNECEDNSKLLECLYMIGANATFEDSMIPSLKYVGKTNKKYSRNMPSTKYLFQLKEYGFEFTNLMTRTDVPIEKLATKDIIQFNLSYRQNDYCEVIYGLKFFSDICLDQSGDCFYAGDIRVAFVGAPKLYAPPVDELFFFLPENQKKGAYYAHNRLIELGCERNLEREYMLKYYHPKSRLVLATIYIADNLYFLGDDEKDKKVIYKFNLRNIGKYADYLHMCTDRVISSIVETTECYGCKKACGGIKFDFDSRTYVKCPFYSFKFDDLSENAIANYLKLLSLETGKIKEIQ